MMLDDLTAELADKTVHSVAHGVVRLEELAPAYGAERRRVRVIKYRGVKFRGGYHDVTITTGGSERVSAAGGVGISLHVSRDTPCQAALPGSMDCSAAASNPDRARLFSVRPAPENR